jgi:hypothetical protein
MLIEIRKPIPVHRIRYGKKIAKKKEYTYLDEKSKNYLRKIGPGGN